MATIYIENRAYQVKDGQNLLQACLGLGLDIPYFCWHPAMHSVGACRQCAVKQFKDASDTKGKIVMACMTPAAEGTRVSISDAEAVAFRAAVAELLMTNHPHDCPVCDEGGECHLQDMTVMTGHTHRRFRFPKRTHRNQYLGPFVNHEMNRCIACYRCVRFYREYAQGRDFGVFGAHHHVFFGRHEDGVLESEFSGNLAEVCPTGVFTDKTFKEHYSRKWDLQTAASICVHCGVGCNTIPGERYGVLRRVQNRYNGEVNGYFLCDRGRYGYEFVNSALRIREPMLRTGVGATPISPDAATRHLGGILRSRERVIGIGSPRASLESNFALRTLVGPDRFYMGLSEHDANLLSTGLQLLQQSTSRIPTLQETAASDAALVLGEDVTNVAPMLALALRQVLRNGDIQNASALGIRQWEDAAVRNASARHAMDPLARAPLFIVAPWETGLQDAAARTCCAAPEEVARIGFAVAHAIHPEAPPVPDLSGEARALADLIAGALCRAEKPLIVSGPSCGSDAAMQAAANVACALRAAGRNAQFCLTLPECNSMGLALMGAMGGLSSALEAVQSGRADTIVILENDLYRRADAALVDALLQSAAHVVMIDHLPHATTAKSEMTLPAATFAEAEGTLVNNEGRAQRFFKVFEPAGAVQESWCWLRDIGSACGREEFAAWQNLDGVMAAMAREIPCLSAVPGVAPPAGFRIAGQTVPRQPLRYSGRTAMHAHTDVHEPPPAVDANSALSFSMEGYTGQPPATLIPRYWAPGWNSVQAVNKFQSEIGGPLRGGDAGKRLIEPQMTTFEYFSAIQSAPAIGPDEWQVVSLHHIFGSDELSLRASSIAELVPRAYLGLGREAMQRLQVADGDQVELVLGNATHLLTVKLVASLADGLAGLPVGLPGIPVVTLPARAQLRRQGHGGGPKG